MELELPSLYQKADQRFYFTYKGRQYYGGTTRATRLAGSRSP